LNLFFLEIYKIYNIFKIKYSFHFFYTVIKSYLLHKTFIVKFYKVREAVTQLKEINSSQEVPQGNILGIAVSAIPADFSVALSVVYTDDIVIIMAHNNQSAFASIRKNLLLPEESKKILKKWRSIYP